MKSDIRKKLILIRKKGFTLAELLIVVAIIAVLVAVSIPIFTGRLEKARIATNEANIRAAKAAAVADWLETAKENNENVDEDVLSRLRAALGLNFYVHAEGGGGSVKNYVEDGTYRTYGYNVGTNDLFAPNSTGTEGTRKGNTILYSTISVRITLDDGTVETSPYITGSGNNVTVNSGFGVSRSEGGSSSTGNNTVPSGDNPSPENPYNPPSIVPGVVPTHGGGSND